MTGLSKYDPLNQCTYPKSKSMFCLIAHSGVLCARSSRSLPKLFPDLPVGSTKPLPENTAVDSARYQNLCLMFNVKRSSGLRLSLQPGVLMLDRKNGPQIPVGSKSNRRAPNRISK